jgi:TPR repeat protein
VVSKCEKLLEGGVDIGPELEKLLIMEEEYWDAGKYELAFECCKQLAESGGLKSSCRLGWMLMNGAGCQKDYKQAEKLLLDAYHGGVLAAGEYLGDLYTIEEYKLDIVKAIQFFNEVSNTESGALISLGRIYLNEKSLHKDQRKGFNCFIQCEKMGNEIVLSEIGYCYWFGLGVGKNIPKALEYYEKAANTGDVDTMLSLSSIFYFGKEVAIDKEKGVFYLKMACDSNSIKSAEDVKWACNRYGRMLITGIEVEKNILKGQEYLDKAKNIVIKVTW